ncbi:putative ATP-dependent RNA helicase DDX28 [Babylonia areolata]|uniref:putative ATP-dependent RNA helicase DDX28 n=1 Tax=Babylonia areolata TaxID=304850 RepID=UPI003FD0C38A
MNRSLLSIGLLLRGCHQLKVCSLHQQICRTLTTHPSTDLPRITIPHKTYARLQKLRSQRKAMEQTSKRSSFKSPLVISCKRNNFNHHRGQTYSDFGPQTLASYGWKHRKSQGDFFTLVCHDKNPALVPEEACKSFQDLHLEDDIVRAVEALGFSSPTSIQNAAVPAILRGESTLCAAETGSGKTLAYLLPALNLLLQRKRCREDQEEILNTPSVIVLVPSRELADQVTRVAESLQQHLDFTTYSVCGGRGTKARLVWPINRPMDILIATPGVLHKLMIAGKIKSSGLQQIILDEADTLLDDSFMDVIDRVLYRLKIPTLESGGGGGGGGVQQQGGGGAPKGFVGGVQFVLVSATMPRGLEGSIGAYIPVDQLRKVSTSGLHRLMPHVPQKFLRLRPSQKSEELLKLVRGENQQQSGGSTMVFCKDSSTSFYVGHVLQEHGLQPAIVNGDMQEKIRHFEFERFQSGHRNILIATDMVSRGIDTVGVHQVINYDFPQFVSDYIHRAGRVGRVGSQHRGQVTSFVAHKWEVDILWQIEIAARKSAELHNVNANIKRKLMGNFAKKHGVSPKEL